MYVSVTIKISGLSFSGLSSWSYFKVMVVTDIEHNGAGYLWWWWTYIATDIEDTTPSQISPEFESLYWAYILLFVRIPTFYASTPQIARLLTYITIRSIHESIHESIHASMPGSCQASGRCLPWSSLLYTRLTWQPSWSQGRNIMTSQVMVELMMGIMEIMSCNVSEFKEHNAYQGTTISTLILFIPFVAGIHDPRISNPMSVQPPIKFTTLPFRWA